MARGRLISRTLGASRKFAALHQTAGDLAEFAQSLYPLLVSCSDDFGRQSGDAFTVKCVVFPSSPRVEAEFEAALGALVAAGLIHRYDVGGSLVVEIVEFDPHQPGLHKRTKSRFPAFPGNFTEIPSESNRTEQKRTEGKRTDLHARAARACADATTLTAAALDLTATAVVRTASVRAEAETLRDTWNAGTTPPIPKALKLTPGRTQKCQARLKEHPLPEWVSIVARIEQSAFCRGQVPGRNGGPPWVATFDWLIRGPDVAEKVLEGVYDNRAGPSGGGSGKTAGNFGNLQRFAAKGSA